MEQICMRFLDRYNKIDALWSMTCHLNIEREKQVLLNKYNILVLYINCHYLSFFFLIK